MVFLLRKKITFFAPDFGVVVELRVVADETLAAGSVVAEAGLGRRPVPMKYYH